MNKNWLWIAPLMLLSLPASAEWTYVDGGEGYDRYLDLDSLSREGRRVRVWEVDDNEQPDRSGVISLRSRGTSNRPFTVVNNIRRRAEAQFLREEQALQQKLTATQTRLAELEGIAIEREMAGLPYALMPPEYLSDDATEAQKATLVAVRQLLSALTGRSI